MIRVLTAGAVTSNGPSIQARNGLVHLAYVEGVAFDVIDDETELPVRYAVLGPGGWAEDRVSVNGTTPVLQLSSAGLARIAFGDVYCLLPGHQVHLMTVSNNGTYATQVLPGSYPNRRLDMALDTKDQAHVIWEDDSTEDVRYSRRGVVFWTGPNVLTTNYARLVAIATDADNAAHIIVTTIDYGVWYFSNRHGTFESHQLLGPGTTDFGVGSCSIAVDPTDRAHMLFVVGENTKTAQLW